MLRRRNGVNCKNSKVVLCKGLDLSFHLVVFTRDFSQRNSVWISYFQHLPVFSHPSADSISMYLCIYQLSVNQSISYVSVCELSVCLTILLIIHVSFHPSIRPYIRLVICQLFLSGTGILKWNTANETSAITVVLSKHPPPHFEPTCPGTSLTSDC